jgi:hypothetical protein
MLHCFHGCVHFIYLFIIFFIFRGNVLAENPLNTSLCSMDGKQGKLSALIMGPRLGGIKRVKPVTNNKHDKLMSGSRAIELIVEAHGCAHLWF